MKAQCIEAIEGAIGRPLSGGESRSIEQRLRAGMLRVAQEDPTRWHGLSQDQRLVEGAARAAAELVEEATKRKVRTGLAILAHDKVQRYVADQVTRGADADGLSALSRMIAGRSDAKNNGTSAHALRTGIVATSLARLTDAWEAIRPGMLGLLANPEAEAQFMRAVHGDTRNIEPAIAQAAKDWLEVAETLRLRFNAAGGEIGKLDNWGMPHAWHQDRAVKAGKAAFVQDLMGLVDRKRYTNDDGSLFTDKQMADFLGEAWVTIATNGANKPLGGATPGGSIKANRNRQPRQIHFRDGEAALTALQKYSAGNVFATMIGHVNRMARDIALVETFGPNADQLMRHFVDHLSSEAAKADPTRASAIEREARSVVRLYDFVAGNEAPPANRRMASAFSMLRSWMVAAKLGSAAVTSISDEGTLYMTAKVNNLPLNKVFLNEVAAFNPADKVEARLASRAGLMVHTMADELDRFGAETLGSQVPHKIASAVMRGSGLGAMTEARRRAFSITMMDTIGALTRDYDSPSKLDPGDWKLLRDKGITESEWGVWRLARTDSFRGNDTLLTPEAIYAIPDKELVGLGKTFFSSPRLLKEQAASKLLAVVLEEQDIAVIEPGPRERVMMRAGTEAGTIKGELTRSFFLFKSFPVAMVMRHWTRGLKMYSTPGGKAGYLGMLLATQTLLGALAMEINDILGGKNPRNLSPFDNERWKRNWAAAMLKGGSLGLYGDFLFVDTTDYGRTLLGALAGPVAGVVEDVDDLTRGNIMQAMRGEDTNFGAEMVRFARSNTPGGSLWYAKAALDRMIFHQLQEYFSPGYLDRSKDRAFREYGTTYWWEPGASPADAQPVDLDKAVSE